MTSLRAVIVRADAAMRKRGVRVPRAYWLARFGLARITAPVFGHGARRERETTRPDGDGPRLPPRRGEVRPVALFYAINGTGLGHLTRCLAIARHLRNVKPVFVTTSMHADVLEPFGFASRSFPSFEVARKERPELTRARWNAGLARALADEIERHKPAVIVYDSVAPEPGLLHALRAHPHLGRVAIRRAYRLDGREHVVVARDTEADMLVIPHEPQTERIPIALGPVARWTGSILSSGRDEALTREVARAELGIARDGLALLVQLGSGAVGLADAFRDELMRELAALQLKVVATSYTDVPAGRTTIKRYPMAPLLPAFDIALAAAGYNTFTELLHHGVPTVFVPNERMRSDDQLARAQRAEEAGAALVAREGDVAGMVAAVRRLANDEALRARMAERGRALVPANGGPEAARLIERYAERILTR